MTKLVIESRTASRNYRALSFRRKYTTVAACRRLVSVFSRAARVRRHVLTRIPSSPTIHATEHATPAHTPSTPTIIRIHKLLRRPGAALAARALMQACTCGCGCTLVHFRDTASPLCDDQRDDAHVHACVIVRHGFAVMGVGSHKESPVTEKELEWTVAH